MNEIGCYLKKIHNQLENDFNRKFKKYGLTSTQLDVLQMQIIRFQISLRILMSGTPA